MPGGWASSIAANIAATAVSISAMFAFVVAKRTICTVMGVSRSGRIHEVWFVAPHDVRRPEKVTR